MRCLHGAFEKSDLRLIRSEEQEMDFSGIFFYVISAAKALLLCPVAWYWDYYILGHMESV